MSAPMKLPEVLPFEPIDIVWAVFAAAFEHPLSRLVIAIAAAIWIAKVFASDGAKKRGKRYRKHRPSYRY